VLAYLNRSTTCNYITILDSPLNHHDGIVQAALDLLDKLVCAATQNECARLRLRALLEHVEALAADLPLVELAASAQVLPSNVRACRLDATADSLDDPAQVTSGDTASTEDVAVREPLRREIADGQLAEHNLSARLLDCLELAVDDLPLGVDDGLVVLHGLDSDFSVVLLRLQLEFHVQAENKGIGKGLRLLLGTCIGERLLEGDTLDEQ
jgi:hypothetical protein